jgi:cytoskeletal protein CcmA (bactofilin family)
MFGKREESNVQSIDKVNTIIGDDAEFNGSIKTRGILRIEGKMDGQINSSGDVIISEKGVVDASLKAGNAIIAGTYRGNMHLKGKLEIKATGQASGEIKVDGIIIEDGGLFEGNCEMNQNKKPETTNLKKEKNVYKKSFK